MKTRKGKQKKKTNLKEERSGRREGATSRCTMGPKRPKTTLCAKKNHSIARLNPQRSVRLCSVPLHCAPLLAAPLGGSFVSERVAMY